MNRFKFTFRKDNLLIVFNLAPTTNKKISNGAGSIIQHYTFSKEQFLHFQNGGKIMNMFDFDHANCGNCPFSKNNGYKLGKCYTHKFPQARGFAMMLRGIGKKSSWDDIPELPEKPPLLLVELARGNYIRFGTYGETIHIPLEWYRQLTEVVSSWTGYTHQWHVAGYGKYLMASVHNLMEQNLAADLGYRSFLIHVGEDDSKNVVCPTQTHENVTCATCALCSGTTGKGKKNISIEYH